MTKALTPGATAQQYVDEAMGCANFKMLSDGTWSGEVPGLPWVIAFGDTREMCAAELRSTLIDWVNFEPDRSVPTPSPE